MTDTWDAAQYERFKEERTQPFLDLVELCTPVPGGRMIDLGCGTGALTRVAHEQLEMGETVGLDRSEAMLERASEHAGDAVRFEHGDLRDARPDGRYDVVLSNAALHWLPNQREIIERWARALDAGGQLAVQVPANFEHPSHTVAWAVGEEPGFAAELRATNATDDDGEPGVLLAEEYSQLLFDLGFAEQHVRLQVYLHRLDSSVDVVEWTRGTLLQRWQRALSPDSFERFVDRYRERLLAEIGEHSPYAFTFNRILMWGRMR